MKTALIPQSACSRGLRPAFFGENLLCVHLSECCPVNSLPFMNSSELSASKKTQESAFKARLSAAIERSGLSQTELAQRIGTPPSTIGGWVRRGSLPRGSVLLELCRVLDIRSEWLLSGTPPMVNLEPAETELMSAILKDEPDPTPQYRQIAETLAAGPRGALATMSEGEVCDYLSEVIDRMVSEATLEFRKSAAYDANVAITELRRRFPYLKSLKR